MGSPERMCAASISLCEAENSPSAWMSFARFSRSASACLAMARSIDSGRSTCLTSTFVTFTPQGCVCWSRIVGMREQIIELHFAENGAQRGLRELRCLVAVVEHFDDGTPRLDDAQEHDRVHLQRDVVARDDVLRRDFE